MQSTATRTRRNATDEPFTSNGPWEYPLVGLLAAAFLYLASRTAHLPVWWPVTIAIPAAGVRFLVDWRKHKRPLDLSVFRAACLVAPPVWAVIAYVAGTRSLWVCSAVLLLGALAAAFWAAGLAPAPADEALVPEYAVPLPPVAPTVLEHDWAKRLRILLNTLLAVKGTGLTLSKWTIWPDEAGYTAEYNFPPGGRITVRKVLGLTEELEAELRLAAGCTLRITPGQTKASVRIEVMLRNELAKNRPYPTELKPGTIRDGLPIGFTADGRTALINVHQDSILVTGMRGSGKTVLLHGLIASLAQRRDTLIWTIDLNGGGIGTQWLRPYAADEVDHPVIDWMAPDPLEAIKMADALERIALFRKYHYASLMAEAGTDILPVSPTLPAIIVLVDEGGEIFGGDASREAQYVASKLLAVQRIARSVCIQIVITTQRGTITYLPSDVKKATAVRMCGIVADDDELGSVLDWNSGVHVRDLQTKGEWFLRNGVADTPEKIKTFTMDPRRVGAIAREVEQWRPRLDQPSRDHVAEVYDNRWQRIRGWLRNIAGLPADDADEVKPAPVVPGRDTWMSAEEQMQRVRDLAAKSAALREVPVNVDVDRGDQVTPEELAEVEPAADEVPDWARKQLEQIRAERTPAELDGLPPGAVRYYELLLEAGEDGMRTKALEEQLFAEGYSERGRRGTVNEWKVALLNRGLVSSHPSGYATWVAAQYLPQAA